MIMKTFSMRVKRTVQLGHRTGTVFVGPIDGMKELISECQCELLNDGEVLCAFAIDGEVLGRRTPSPDRTLSTSVPVAIDEDVVKQGGVVLRSVGEVRSPRGHSMTARSEVDRGTEMTEQDATRIATEFMAAENEKHHRAHGIADNSTYHHLETALRPQWGGWIAVFVYRALDGSPIDGPVGVRVDPVSGTASWSDT
jgi:hypothetical protein